MYAHFGTKENDNVPQESPYNCKYIIKKYQIIDTKQFRKNGNIM